MASSTFDVQAVRSQFPALAHDQVYFDNVSEDGTPDDLYTEAHDYCRQAAVKF